MLVAFFANHQQPMMDPMIVSKRYQMLHLLGAGGMGEVYAAEDRLTGEHIALKRVLVKPNYTKDPSTRTNNDLRYALANEFQVLSSLRHPGIISVMDYGFDAERNPYYTMTLLHQPQDILAAAQTSNFNEKIDLLVQTLQALAYLHRQGILHRDLKPANILLDSQNTLKLLDFGLATHKGTVDDPRGTLLYMPPEVITQQEVTARSDLYAVGLIAYEMFAGEYPFEPEHISVLIKQMLYEIPDMQAVPEAIRPIIHKMVMKDPMERFPNAESVLVDLQQLTNGKIHIENADMRESYLQAAHFVGRDAELAEFSVALKTMLTDSTGAAWLIGGESGVGKSRLIEEMRTLALLEGVFVVRGQCVANGGLHFHPWRNVARRLALEYDLTDLEISILHELVPDIDTILERSVMPLPLLEHVSAQQRIVETLVGLFRQQQQPILLILEDLHWAVESLLPLRRLVSLVNKLPLLIIGSYRNDEKPGLPEHLPGMKVISLGRLSRDNIAALSATIVGDEGNRAQLVDYLHEQTEGNVFFIIETMRALAEEFGELRLIGMETLPANIMQAGMEQIVVRRLARLPAEAMPALQFAAVVGRKIELPLMQAFLGDELDMWLQLCMNAAILEVQENEWRFAHDKLRESLLEQLEPMQNAILHRQAAELLEEIYPNDSSMATVLVEYWRIAGDIIKEAYYAVIATQQQLNLGILSQAHTMLDRALALSTPDIQVQIQLFLLAGEIYFDLGKPDISSQYYADCLRLARELEQSDIEGMALEGLGTTATARSQFQEAERWFNESLAVRRRIGDLKGIASVLHFMNTVERLRGSYELAWRYLEESIALRRTIDDPRGLADSLYQMSVLARNAGRYDEARTYLEEGRQLRLAIGDGRGLADDLNSLGICLMLMGKFEEAAQRLYESLQARQAVNNQRGVASCLNALGELEILAGNYQGALRNFSLSLSTWTTAQDKWNIANCYASLGFIQSLAGETLSASYNLVTSLKIASEVNANLILLKGLIGLAQLMLRDNPSAAAQLLGLVDAHAATTAGLRAVYFDRIGGNFDVSKFPDDYQIGKNLNLKSVVSEILQREHHTIYI